MEPAQYIPSRHYNFIEKATALAYRADGVQRMGALLVKSGRILGQGYNSYLRGTHAEICALGQGTWISNLKGSTLYVVRLRKEQRWGLAAPCPDCQKILKEVGIRQVVYTTNDPINPIILEKWP